MAWFQSNLNGENGSAFQLVMITLALVVILVLLVWLFRQIFDTPTRRAARNRVPRLSITDVTAIDQKRFLILARRDNVEHLILIGGASDLVVETNIIRTQAVNQPGPGKTATPPVREREAEPAPAPIAAATVPLAAAAALIPTVSAEPGQEKSSENEPAPVPASVPAPVNMTEVPQPVVDMEVRAAESSPPALEPSTAASPAPAAPPAKEEPSDSVAFPGIENLGAEEPGTELQTELPTEPGPNPQNPQSPVLAATEQGIPREDIEPAEPQVADTTVSANLEKVVNAAHETHDILTPGEMDTRTENPASLASDIDARLSRQLDEALAIDALDLEATATAKPEVEQSSEDDMEKLLQELAAETR